MLNLTKNKKLGEGAYGIVYEGTMENEKGEQKVAIKRNYGDEENKGLSCLRELNFLAGLSHPCITKLKSVSVGDPFPKSCPMTPRPKRNDMKEDSHHFVLEYADTCLDDYYLECDDFNQLKIIMAQILLGVEFLHGKEILHRDLKPGNILVLRNKKLPYAKICDFGLSCFSNKYRPSTPGTVTSWYRAPEICCEYDDYSFPSDIWSVGCIFYEIVTKSVFIQVNNDSNKNLFKNIIKNLPQKFTVKDLNTFIRNGDCTKFKHNYQESNNNKKKGFLPLLEKKIKIESFNKSKGTLEEFSDLLSKMLELHPDKRLTASQCLDHSFFSPSKNYIAEMREKFPVGKSEEDKIIEIHDCLERRWAANILIKIYNRRENLDWYSDHLIFHTLRLYDQYLDYCFKNEEIKKRENIERDLGKIFSESENSINVYTCIYIMYKYFCSLYRLHRWEEIFPKHMVVDSNVKKIEELEKLILEKVVSYSIFQDTLIEYLSRDSNGEEHRKKELNIRTYFMNYCNINCNYKGTMKDLYYQIKETQCN